MTVTHSMTSSRPTSCRIFAIHGPVKLLNRSLPQEASGDDPRSRRVGMFRTAHAASSWKPRTRHCFGRRGRGQRLCEMVARSVSLCAAGSRWRGWRTSPSLAARHERAHGASRPLPRIPAKVSSSKRQRTLSLRGGDRPSCPISVIVRRGAQRVLVRAIRQPMRLSVNPRTCHAERIRFLVVH